MEVDTNARLSFELEDCRNGHIDKRSDRGRTLSATASRCADVEHSEPDVPKDETVSLIRERLEQHPHFRGRASLLQIETIGSAVVLSGRLPSYYLKQLLQEAVKKIPDVAHVDNRVDITFQ
jgi:hypothetical protein